MLNSLYPVLLFYTISTEKDGKRDFLPPIPIYLDEDLTQISVESESESLQIATESLADIDKENGLEIVQKGLSQTVILDLAAREDSPALSKILPLLKMIAVNVIGQNNYKVAYFHKDILIFDAKLLGYDKRPESGTNLIKLSITLEIKPDEEKEKTDKDSATPLPYSSQNPYDAIGADGEELKKVTLIPAEQGGAGVDIYFPKVVQREASL